MSNKSQSTSGGISFFGLLGIVFITLKLLGITEVATWSWWWVTLPLWGGMAFVVGLIALFFLMLIALAGLGMIAIGIIAVVGSGVEFVKKLCK